MDTNGTSMNGHVSPTSRDLDRAWALFHCQLVLDGVAGPRHLAEQFRRYDVLATEVPALRGAAMAQIERLIAEQKRGAYAPA